jgi:hypothetical protein
MFNRELLAECSDTIVVEEKISDAFPLKRLTKTFIYLIAVAKRLPNVFTE